MSQSRIEDLDLDRLYHDLSVLKKKVILVTGHCAQNRMEMTKLEHHIKKNVECSFLEWRACLDERHEAWQQIAEKHLSVVEKEVAEVTATMRSEIAIVRENGAEAVDNMMNMVKEEHLNLSGRGDKLETFAMAQFATLETRLSQLDVLVQQALETLDDVKNRQSTVAKTMGKLDKEGPLSALLKSREEISRESGSEQLLAGENGKVTKKEIEVRVANSMQKLKQRSSSRSRDNVQKEIHNTSEVAGRIGRAQSLAETRRGRSLQRRVRAAQELAADTTRRLASEPPCLLFKYT